MRALPKLIAITAGRASMEDRARAVEATSAGLPGVLLREPGLSDRELLSFAKELREQSDEVWIGIHDRAHLALAAEFDAVHLGFRSLAPHAVRAMLPAEKAVGFSAHASDEPDARIGADYLFFSPIKETASKSGLLEPTGFAGLKTVCEASELPIIALGGLAPEDVEECLAAGAHGVACLSDILLASDPGERVELWRAALLAAQEVRA